MSGLQLVDETMLYRIHNNLAETRVVRNSYGALWFNTLMFLGVVGFVVFFLVTQYHSSKEVLQPVNIPKTDLAWNNPVRNAIDG
jgi:hypothetical protein